MILNGKGSSNVWCACSVFVSIIFDQSIQYSCLFDFIRLVYMVKGLITGCHLRGYTLVSFLFDQSNSCVYIYMYRAIDRSVLLIEHTFHYYGPNPI